MPTLQDYFLQKHLFKGVNENIIKTMFEIAEYTPTPEQLKESAKYIKILFYKFIDDQTEKSLELKSQSIRINGYFVSLSFDLILFLIINVIVQVIMILIKHEVDRIIILNFSFALLILFIFFLKKTLNIQLELNKKQLEITKYSKQSDVKSKLNSFVNS